MDKNQAIFILNDMILEHDAKYRYGATHGDEFYANEHLTIADALRFAVAALAKDGEPDG